MVAGPDVSEGRTVEALQRELAAALAERDAAQAREAALAEVLRVISQSPSDVQPVLDVVVKAAQRFCGADDVVISLREGAELVMVAHDGPIERPPQRRQLDRSSTQGRAVIDRKTIHLPDIQRLDPAEWSAVIALSKRHGAQATLAAPMLREGAAIGAIMMRKFEVGPFSPRQAELLETFAAQAVIAIENARLFTEQRELLEQQTATAEILRVISQSPTDVEPVMAAVARAAVRFCGAEDAHVFLRDDDELVSSAHEGPLSSHPFGYRDALDASNTARAETVLEARVTHLPDTLAPEVDAAYRSMRENSTQHGFRAQLNAPMLRDGRAIGCICLRRREPGAFTTRQIELLETFAAQAVIAIENVRLFTEQRELLEQQTASADVLRVISQSPTSVQPVFDAIAESALRLLNGWSIIVWRYEDGRLYPGAIKGGHPGSAATFRSLLGEVPPDDIFIGEAVRQGVVRQIIDVEAEPYLAFREMARVRGWRSNLAVPMMREGRAVGLFTLSRREPGAFSEREVNLLQSFADQAVIAVENVRLFTELRESLEQQTASAEILEVISQSPTDVTPVLTAVAKAAIRFCNSPDAVIWLREGDDIVRVAHEGPLFTDVGARRPLSRNSAVTRAVTENRTIHYHDLLALDPVEFADLQKRARERGYRASLAAPLLREGQAIGAIVLRKQEAVAYTERQIELLEAFAAQAVIAIENVRLFTEQRELLEQQTATADILQTINASPGDAQPVFQAIVDKAMTLCGAAFGMFNVFDGERFHTTATRGVPEAYARYRYSNPPDYGPGTSPARLIAGEDYVQIADMADSDVYRSGDPNRRAIVDLGGARTILNLALRKEDVLVGMIAIYRQEVRPFTDKQIALLQSFAGQAVIGMENARLLTELRESLEYQTATSEVLEVIGRSTSDIQPVLDTMLGAALRLCATKSGGIAIQQGEGFRYVATLGWDPEADGIFRSLQITPGRGTMVARVLAERRVVQIEDVASDPEYERPDMAKLAQWHTALGVPLMRDGQPIGAIAITRDRIEPFTERQIALVKTFADQAVIAMENARLLGELRERTDDLTQSLEYQTATSEVLEVIGRSTADIQPVLDTMLSSACRLCGVQAGGVTVRRGDAMFYVATLGLTPEFDKFLRETAQPIDRGSAAGRAAFEKDVVHIPDLEADPEYALPQAATLGRLRSLLCVPLLREGEAVGTITLARTRVEPFTERQVALVRTFADQAVIAMENARLLGELTRREEELRVTFDHMGDAVVMFDAELKLAAWNRNFQEMLDVSESFLVSRPDLDDYVRLLVERGELGDQSEESQIVRFRERVAQQWSNERTRPNGRVLEVRNNPVPGGGAVLIYSDITERKQAEAEIAAARDAAEAALERQTATADILKVIASSPTDVNPVLKAVVGAARRFCGADDAMIVLREEAEQLLATHEGSLQSLVGSRFPLDRSSASGRATIDGLTFHIPDVASLDPAEHAMTIELTRRTGVRALLAAPLLREGQAIGCVLLRKPMPGAFTPHQIELLETFAAQAVIAIENVRLFTELRDSLERLKAAQANLVQSEKMASLGQLTAGIAHEIKNPLNFVNNFASLSVELLDELKEVAGPALATLDADKRAELDETMGLLIGNLGKINEHGKRADGIVRSMLSHSRGGSGDWQASDINALVEEALNLAYHGARAQDKEFNVTLERDLGPSGAAIEVVPQDVTRVFLNLFGNGFYAANKRRGAKQAGYRPTLKVSTRDLGEAVEVRVRDNGTGIAPEVRDKLFQPFFTTKPTGEGTGLGLSISYDIVTQQHGGTIEVESEVGRFTEFTVRLPRRRAAPAKGA